MIRVEVRAGDHISLAARNLVAAAAEHGEAELTFNDIVLSAKRGDMPEDVLSSFDWQCQQRHEDYINSPEGKAAAARNDAEIGDAQERHDCLMRDLATLDFKDDVAVIDWLCAMQPCSDRVGVAVRKSDILAAFDRAGFKPNVNTGASYRENDRENSFRYLVGQALSTLQACAIHGMFVHFAKQWKARWLSAE